MENTVRRRLGQVGLGLGATLTLVAGASLAPAPAEAAAPGRSLKKASIVRPWLPATTKLAGQPGKPRPLGFHFVAPSYPDVDMSSDGRYIATYVHDSIKEPTNSGIRVTDTYTGATTRVTTDLSEDPSISDDGRYVAYNFQGGIYLADRRTGQITLVSEDAESNMSPEISADGSTVVYLTVSELDGAATLMSWQRKSGQRTVITPGAGVSYTTWLSHDGPSVSADGSAIAFWSWERLVDADSDDSQDIYLAKSGSLTLVSNSADAMVAPSISADGNRIAYHSFTWTPDPNVEGEGALLTSDVYAWSAPVESTPAVTTTITRGAIGTRSDQAALSGDGRYVIFQSDVSGLRSWEIYRHDLSTGATMQITNSESASTEPAVDADGDTIALSSSGLDGSTNYGVFVWRG